MNPETKNVEKHYQRQDVRKVLIVAGSAKQANFCAKENGWMNWEYIHNPQQLATQSGVRVVFYGTYWENQNQRRIRELIEYMISEKRAVYA